jgi:hypothetical protein
MISAETYIAVAGMQDGLQMMTMQLAVVGCSNGSLQMPKNTNE